MKKLLFLFLALLVLGSYFISAGATQTGKATLTVVGCDEDCQGNQDYSSNITGEVVADESHVSLFSRIINFFIGFFD